MIISRSKNKQAQKQAFAGKTQPEIVDKSKLKISQNNTDVKQSESLKLQPSKTSLNLTETHINVFNHHKIKNKQFSKINQHGDIADFSANAKKSNENNDAKPSLNNRVKPGITYASTIMKTTAASGFFGAVAFAVSHFATKNLNKIASVGLKAATTAAVAATPLLTLPANLNKAARKIQDMNTKENLKDAINERLAAGGNTAEDIKDMAKAARYLRS